MEPINKFYGIFSVVDQRLTCYHVVIIITHTVTMDLLLVLNALVSIINHSSFNSITILITDSTNCTHGEIKLYGGQFRNEGDLQLCYNGVWVFVCNWWWWIEEANVVCRQLGYANNSCKLSFAIK